MIESLLDQVATYPALFVVCCFSGLGVPMPEDVPLLVAGLQLADGRFSWGPALVTAFAGVTVRDSGAWALGRFLGDRLLQASWFQRLVPTKKITQAQEMLAERGAAAVLAGRFMVGFRVPMFLAAGAAHVPYRTFVAYDLLGMTVAVPLVITLGYAFGPAAIEVASALLPYSRVLAGVVIAVGTLVVVRRLRQNGQTPDPDA